MPRPLPGPGSSSPIASALGPFGEPSASRMCISITGPLLSSAASWAPPSGAQPFHSGRGLWPGGRRQPSPHHDLWGSSSPEMWEAFPPGSSLRCWVAAVYFAIRPPWGAGESLWYLNKFAFVSVSTHLCSLITQCKGVSICLSGITAKREAQPLPLSSVRSL